MKLFSGHKKSGFTLIETMVAVSIFAIVVTIGIASLLSMNAAYKISRRDRAVVDGIAGAIERMAREIKTGYQYVCDPSNLASISSSVGAPSETCTESLGFIATEAGGIHNQIYALDSNEGVITLTSEGYFAEEPIPITPAEVTITRLDFTLVENEIGGGQPYVIIRIDGTTDETELSASFSLQTLVTQRFPDTTL